MNLSTHAVYADAGFSFAAMTVARTIETEFDRAKLFVRLGYRVSIADRQSGRPLNRHASGPVSGFVAGMNGRLSDAAWAMYILEFARTDDLSLIEAWLAAFPEAMIVVDEEDILQDNSLLN